jgi:hypothetical protein
MNLDDFAPSKQDKGPILSMGLHLADISNQTKPWTLCQFWVESLFREFFHQVNMFAS